MPDITTFPSYVTATLTIMSWWKFNLWLTEPCLKFQIITNLSLDPLTTMLLLYGTAIDVIGPSWSINTFYKKNKNVKNISNISYTSYTNKLLN